MGAWYVADFETTSARYYEKHGYTKVWLWSICDENSEIVAWGKDIDTFIQWCKKNNRAEIYFHNLKFDGSFILNYLLSNNYPHTDKVKVHDSRRFSTLISDDGQYYQIKVNFGDRKIVTFLDSLKLIPLKVEQIAKIFNLPIRKLKIDYDKYEITDEVLDYVFNDVKIVAMALKFFKNQGFDKMTIGSCAYNKFFDEFSAFKQLFPKLDREWLVEWRKAYRGGRTQVNPRYAGKILENVNRYDINSMYPYAMSRWYMPYDYPISITKRGRYKFELYKVNIIFKLKNGHLPTLLKSGNRFNNTDETYYIESDGLETIYISNIDLDLLYKHYDIKYIEYLEMYGFKTSKFIFTEFIDKYYELKNNSTGGLKLIYKLVINNLYGKFGSKCYGKTKIPQLKDNALEFTTTEEEEMKQYYLPVAIAITSYCHKLIDDAIEMTGIENFVYCDTDSVHTLGALPKEVVDNKEIGKFKYEGCELKAKYIRQKCYIYKEENDTVITCAGMTESIKNYLFKQYKDDVFKIFDIGLKVDENSPNIKLEDLKLRPKQVMGGTILTPIPFSLN